MTNPIPYPIIPISTNAIAIHTVVQVEIFCSLAIASCFAYLAILHNTQLFRFDIIILILKTRNLFLRQLLKAFQGHKDFIPNHLLSSMLLSTTN